MGQVREEKFCYLQGQDRASGSFLFITPSRAFFVVVVMSVHGASGMLVEGDR